MRPHRLLALAPLLYLTLGLNAAWAGTLYKQVDAQGRIVLGDTPHPGWRTLEVIQTPDPSPAEEAAAQQSRAEAAQESAAAERAMEQRQVQQDRAYAELQAALEAVRQAEAALAVGQEPLPGERLGTRSGFSRLGPEYFQRQQQLEANLQAARQRLEAARQAWQQVR